MNTQFQYFTLFWKIKKVLKENKESREEKNICLKTGVNSAKNTCNIQYTQHVVEYRVVIYEMIIDYSLSLSFKIK